MKRSELLSGTANSRRFSISSATAARAIKAKFYYSSTMHRLTAEIKDTLRKNCHVIRSEIRELLGEQVSSKTLPTSEDYWHVARSSLNVIEERLKIRLQKRSKGFWLHLYRRIAPYGYSIEGRQLDHATTHIMRHQAELAIKKFGGLPDDSIGPAGDIAADDFLDGEFLKSETNEFGSREKALEYFDQIKTTNQYVMRDFKLRDLILIYETEFLAIEYWKTCAALRAIGKSKKTFFCVDTCWFKQSALDIYPWMFEIYDQRNQRYSDIISVNNTTPLSISKNRNSYSHLLAATYNCNHKDNEGILYDDVTGKQESVIMFPNFGISSLDIEIAHPKYEPINKLVQDKLGFSVLDLMRFLYYLQTCFIMSNSLEKSNVEKGISDALTNVQFRGYLSISGTLGSIREHMEASEVSWDPSFDRVFDFIYLKEEEVCLWARSKNHVLIPMNRTTLLFDLAWIFYAVSDVFYRIVSENGDHGSFFEDLVESVLKSTGAQYTKNKILKFSDGSQREADFLVENGNSIIILECSAINRSIDYEISKPDVVNRRRRKIEKKLLQAKSLCDTLAAEPIGRNFDHQGIERFDWRVVSPFCEFAWDDVEPWFDENIQPRCLAIGELVEFLSKGVLDIPLLHLVPKLRRNLNSRAEWY